MKKFTIATFPEYEWPVLESVGKTGAAHLSEVTGSEFARLIEGGKKEVNYSELWKKFHALYQKHLEYARSANLSRLELSMADVKKFTNDPESMINEVMAELEQSGISLNNEKIQLLKTSLTEVKVQLEQSKASLSDEKTKFEQSEASLEEAKTQLEQSEADLAKTKEELKFLLSSKPTELGECLAIGVVQVTLLPSFEAHLKRKEGLTYSVDEKSPAESFILIYGPESAKMWIDTIFHLFDVKAVECPTKDVGEKPEEEIKNDTRVRELEDEVKNYDQRVKELEEEIKKYDGRAKDLENEIKNAENAKEIEDNHFILEKAATVDLMLRTLSDKEIPILRTKELSVIQGYVPGDKLSAFKQEMDSVDKKTEQRLVIQYEDPSYEERAPMNLTVRPKFFNPAITLTKLRGWPNSHEINPTLITILVFSFQFGLMFGDVGQGLIILVLGLLLSRKFKSGMQQKLGVMFVPMGIFSIIFGFLYGEVFLIEGILHPLWLSPLHSIGQLMKTVLGIAVLEMCGGFVLGAINQYKEGNIVGVIGEHGVSGILFLVGLYFGALYFLAIGNFFALLSHWSFYMMLSGLATAFVEPALSAVSKHEKIKFETVIEGFAALLLTFVENLGNFFSFLRCAAFALAHACLALAAEALVGAMGLGGILLMNIIAMSFEFVSSCVQSLRLLYYEFMNKFFHDSGLPYKPFVIQEK